MNMFYDPDQWEEYYEEHYGSSMDTQKVIDVLEEWFWAIEDGSANQRMPDPDGEKISAGRIDALIDTIDKFIEGQVTYSAVYFANKGKETKGKPMNEPAEFNRLEGAAREAFAQDVFRKIKEVYGDD